MPDLLDANRPENISASEEIRRITAIQKSLSQGTPELRQSRRGDKENDPRADRRGLGCEAKAAYLQWHKFARSHPGFSLTGQREFSSDLDLILVAENEAQSLTTFVNTLNLDGVGLLQSLAERRAKRTIGSEHYVFLVHDQKQVFKLTREGKYGRIRDTPSQY